MNKYTSAAALLAALLAMSGSANAALSFDAITSYVDGETVLAGVAAIVGIQIAPTAGKWAFRKVMAMFGR
ncbi:MULTISPECIES: hypothetical protein [Aeromonas]|uniref:hypothetical protein n=1 Tax=Aeromonas TaxID=642 RepID=UPI002DD6B0E6|nr:hypothetical protein [Aeromonas caviae]